MILGIDHLALSAADVELAVEDFRGHGYKLVFLHRGVVNDEAKKPLLGRYTPRHDLALLRHEGGGIAIELTAHSQVREDMRGPYALDGDGAVRLRTPDPAADRNFLVAGLGFAVEGEDLVFISPVRAWRSRLRLELAPGLAPATLDAAGHPCLALLCKNLDQELDRVRAGGGGDLTPAFALTVNGRALRIALFRLPGGALLELIEPKGSRR